MCGGGGCEEGCWGVEGVSSFLWAGGVVVSRDYPQPDRLSYSLVSLRNPFAMRFQMCR